MDGRGDKDAVGRVFSEIHIMASMALGSRGRLSACTHRRAIAPILSECPGETPEPLPVCCDARPQGLDLPEGCHFLSEPRVAPRSRPAMANHSVPIPPQAAAAQRLISGLICHRNAPPIAANETMQSRIR
jgi:hypothetical protein